MPEPTAPAVRHTGTSGKLLRNAAALRRVRQRTAPTPDMITRLSHAIALLAVFSSVSTLSSAAAEERASARETPKPRPRLTDSARTSAAEVARENDQSGVVTLDKVEVRERRLPSGPVREPQTVEAFTATGGGYLLKKEGAAMTTEVGLWRHISVLPHVDEARDGTTAVRMGVLSISW